MSVRFVMGRGAMGARTIAFGLMLAAGACTCGETTPPVTGPSLAFQAPLEGAAFDLTDDLLPDRPGVQLEAVFTATALDGATVTLTVPGSAVAPPTAILRGGTARIIYTLAESGELAASATDGTNAATATPVNVTLDPSPLVCKIVQPSNGAVLGAADDLDAERAGFQARIRVRCAGVPLGSPVALSVGGAAIVPVPLGPGGVAEFAPVDLLEGESELVAVATLDGGEEVRATARVTVRTGACRVTIAPASSTVFNARAEGTHERVVADLTPGSPMQAALVVETAADCAGGELSIVAGDAVLATTSVSATRLEVPVELPEGAIEVRAKVAGTVAGESPVVRYTVDSVLPTVTISAPAASAVLKDSDDVDAATPGLQIRATGRFTGIGAGRPCELVLDRGTPGEKLFPGTLAEDETFEVVLDLPTGDHALVARAARELGTTAISEALPVRSEYVGGTVRFVSPTEGGAVDLSGDADTNVPGIQVSFALATTGLAGAEGLLRCGDLSTPFTVLADNTAAARLSFDGLACAGTTVSCSASVTAATGAVFNATDIRFLVDGTPPVVQLISPAVDGTSASALIAVAATTACTGETQAAEVLRGNVQLATQPVVGNVVSIPAVQLGAGENLLTLRVVDAAGNATDAPFRVFVDSDAPVPEFIDPAVGRTYTATDDTRPDLTDGLQATVRVAVDNELVGSIVELRVGTRGVLSARTVLDPVSGRKLATFDHVSLPEGQVELRACGIDEAGTSGCSSRNVEVSTGRPRCDVSSPADGSLLGRRADLDAVAPGVQANIVVDTDAPTGSSVQLTATAPDGTSSIHVASVVAGAQGGLSTATLASFSFVQDGAWTLVARCTAADGTVGSSLENHLSSRLSASAVDVVDPVEAQVLNLATPDRGTAAGFQVDVLVQAVEPSPGASITLTTNCGQGPQVAGPVPVDAAQFATFRGVSLPEEADCTFSAVLEDAAGNVGPVAVRNARVDRIAPVVQFSGPSDLDIFGARLDAVSSTPEFEVAQVVASLTDVGTRREATLAVNGQDVASSPVFSGSDAIVRATWRTVVLAEGRNILRVTALDAAGNPGVSQIVVTVDTRGPVVNIANFVNDQVLNGSADRDPTRAGLQQDVFLYGEKLGVGTTVSVTGNGALLGEAAMGGGAAVVSGITFPEGAVALRARAEDSAGNTAQSAEVRIVVDTVAPIVTSLTLLSTGGGTETVLDTQQGSAVFGQSVDGSAVQPGLQARVRAAISGVEARKGLRARLITTNPAPGTVLAEQPLADDGTVSFDVTLREGGHRLHLAVSDAAGNPASTPEFTQAGVTATVLNFGVDVTSPSLSVLAPLPGLLLAKDDVDPATPGLQTDVDVDSDAGAAREVAITLDGQPLTTLVLPTGSRRVSGRVTVPEGAHDLAASTVDVAGNTAQAGPVRVTVDSVAPTVTIAQPVAGSTISSDADPETEGFQISVTIRYGEVETGRTLVLTSSVAGALAQVATDATGEAVLSGLTVPAGAQVLTAKVSDASGNESTATAAVTIDTGAPGIRFVDPSGLLYFGRADGFTATTCTPEVEATCDTDGAIAVLVVNGIEQSPVTVVGGRVRLPGLSIAQGATARVQLKATDAQGRVGYSASRQATCDLVQPALTITTPTATSVKYVAFGNPGQVAGALSDRVPGTPLEADLSASVTGATGGTVTVTSSLDGVVATQEVTGDPYVASFSSVAFPSKGLHTVTISVSTRARNTASDSFSADVDVVAPAAANPAAAAAPGFRTRVVLTFPAPGDDDASGGPVARYLVRRAEAAIDDELKWAAATVLSPTVTVADAGSSQSIVLDDEPFEKLWFYAVRAVDAAGNLGPVGASGSADLRNTRRYFGVPTGSSYAASRMTFGDLDLDGRDDLIASVGLPNGTGELRLFYGADTPGSAVVLTVKPPTGLTTNGVSRFGYSVTTGDVTGDGIDDLLVGAPNETAPGSTAGVKDGAIYLYFGRAGTRLVSGATADAVVYGKIGPSDTPSSIVVGMPGELAVADVNGDGVGDIVAASSYENGARGIVRVFAGRATWPTSLAASGAFADITSERTIASGPRLGWKLASLGDVNGDGKADLVIAGPQGAASAPTPGLRPVYVVSGALAGPGTIVERISAAVHSFDAATSTPTSSLFGFDVATGDVTGDGKADLMALDVTGRLVVASGASLATFLPTTPNAAGVLPDASSARVGAFQTYAGSGGGVPLLRFLGDVTGDGVGDFGTTLAGTTTANELSVFYGRAPARWSSVTRPETVIGRVDTSREFGNFACRSAAGRFLGTTGSDIALLDLGGGATVLSFR